MKNFVRHITIAILSILMSFLSTPALALSEQELYFYSQNNILFYDPTTTKCGSTSVGSFDGQSSAGLSDLQASFVDTYHDIAEKLSVAYGIPWETVVAQGILESAAGTSTFAVERNNFFGIAAYDSNVNAAWSWPTPEDGWRGYYENIKNTATYRNHGVFTGDNITNPHTYLQTIKASGYATAPTYVQSVGRLVDAVINRANEKGWKSSAELAAEYPEMLQHAADNAAGANIGTTPEASDISSCTFSGDNGDINGVALNLSWPDRTHRPTDPKPEYYEALAATGVNKLGDSCSMGGYSCDAFLTTVMRSSGSDPNFPCCGAAMQLRYLSSHEELYVEIPNVGNTSNLQPGDIRANGGHVEIVVQLDDGSFMIASASHCDRTADHASNYYAGPGYRIFRKK